MTSHVDWIIVVNHRAGLRRSSQLFERLKAILDTHSQKWLLVEVEEHEFADDSLEAALLSHPRTKGIFILGGDGTVHHVANKVLRINNEIPLAVIPTGSGNDFARQCGLLGHEFEGLVDHFLNQRPKDVDVLKVNDSFALQVISTGFDAHVSRMARSRFRRLGRFRYSLIVPLQLFRMHAIEYDIAIDGQRMHITSPLVAVANGNTYGGGMMISPASTVRDGVFELIFVSEMNRLELLRLFPRVFNGKHINHPKVTQIRGRQLSLRASTIAESDGEELSESPIHLIVTVTRLKTWVA